MFTPLAAFLAASAVSASDAAPIAALRFDAETSEWLARIDGGGLRPYRLTIRCARNCSSATPYAEDMSTPLGLFRLSDGEPLLYSVSASAVAYTVSAHTITDRGVTRALVTGSRGRPDFFSEHGTAMIRTYERPTDASGRELSIAPQPVLWRYQAGRFVRLRRRR